MVKRKRSGDPESGHVVFCHPGIDVSGVSASAVDNEGSDYKSSSGRRQRWLGISVLYLKFSHFACIFSISPLL